MGLEIPVIAVDGPAGAGKSTASRRLALRLGFRYYDTGSIYRSLAWAARESGVAWDASEENLVSLCKTLTLEFLGASKDGGDWRVIVNGRDLTRDLKEEEIGRGASMVSARPAVRGALLALQRGQAMEPGLVMEGRDVGTVVFPDAWVKFFVTADPAERARRRWCELKRLGYAGDLASIEQEIRLRDEQDRMRPVSPLVPAAEAVMVDTTKLKIDEVVENMVDISLQRISDRLQANQ